MSRPCMGAVNAEIRSLVDVKTLHGNSGNELALGVLVGSEFSGGDFQSLLLMVEGGEVPDGGVVDLVGVVAVSDDGLIFSVGSSPQSFVSWIGFGEEDGGWFAGFSDVIHSVVILLAEQLRHLFLVVLCAVFPILSVQEGVYLFLRVAVFFHLLGDVLEFEFHGVVVLTGAHLVVVEVVGLGQVGALSVVFGELAFFLLQVFLSSLAEAESAWSLPVDVPLLDVCNRELLVLFVFDVLPLLLLLGKGLSVELLSFWVVLGVLADGPGLVGFE